MSTNEQAREHHWDEDGERCIVCGDKDWMGGPCNGPRIPALTAPAGVVSDAMAKDVLTRYVANCVPHHGDAPMSARIEAMRAALEAALSAPEPAAQMVDSERVAQLIAHRVCCGTEHDPLNGKLHGYCVVCGVPWPCDYAGKPPSTPPAQPAEGVPEGFVLVPQKFVDSVCAASRDGVHPRAVPVLIEEAMDALTASPAPSEGGKAVWDCNVCGGLGYVVDDVGPDCRDRRQTCFQCDGTGKAAQQAAR